MSGPKVVTYTMSAFKGKLKTLMKTQAQLNQLAVMLGELCISDNELNIHYDQKKELEKLKPKIEKAIQQLVFQYKGEFNQATYDSIDKVIEKKISEVNELHKKCDALLSDFNNHKNDYDAYKEYLAYYENSEKSLSRFRDVLTDNIISAFSAENAEIANKAQSNASKVVFEAQKDGFTWGFASKANQSKDNIADHVIGQENKMRDVRAAFLDEVLNSGISLNVKADMFTLNPVISDEVKRISKKIGQLIDNCTNPELAGQYRDSFSKLKQSESMNDLYYYKELHDRIFEAGKISQFKHEIAKVLAVLNAFDEPETLKPDKVFLQQKASNLISAAKLRDKDFNAFKASVQAFYAKNRQLAEEEEVKKREQLFVKSQIINNLENKGYEVMDDLQVIDFEKENDFYLKIPGQQNYLNVKFRDDGSFRYVFQIPENKQSLSVDEQKQKLHEMKNTCDDFVEVLKDLKKMGVDIDIKSDKPIAIESMVSVPDKVKEKIEKTQTVTVRKEQVKKLYLE